MGAGGDLRDLSLDLRDFERSSFPGFATEKLDFGHHGFGEVGAFFAEKKKTSTNIHRNPNAQTLLDVWGCFWCKQSTWLGFCRGGVKFWVVFFLFFVCYAFCF